MHASSMDSPRLSKLYASLKLAGKHGETGLHLQGRTNSIAISTDVSELRQRLAGTGETISCQYFGKSASGRKIYIYRLAAVA